MSQTVENQIESAIEDLYANNQYKLKHICNKEMTRFGGISPKDYDEFYSRAGLEISVAKKNNTYNPSKGKTPLEFFTGVIKWSIWKEMTDRNRGKRQSFIESEETDEYGNVVKKKKFVPTVSIDMPIGNENGIIIKDTLQSNFYIDEEIQKHFKDEKIENFLNGLPKVQRQIAEMIMEDFSVSDIKQYLGLSDKKYTDNFNAMRSFKNISILCSNSNQINFMEDEEMSLTTQTAENCKTDRISIASIVKKIDKHTIRFDHPLQRESDQWSPSMKGNLVSDILQGNKLHPLIFAEQIINGVPIIWDLDGKQRCTNAYSYVNNGYKVSKNIRRWLIKYQTTEKDENGNDILDENGFPIAVNAEFDIRGKKFSDLPEELRDRFLDYSFNYDQYLNCSEEDIGYHIERYNDGKPMTKPQKGITKIGTEFAEMVKSISNMPFFKNLGGYKVSEFKNGMIDRVVIESVMAANYFDNWKKEVEKQCEYLKEHATSETFDDFEDMVERLEKVVTDDVAEIFDSKDSFLYFSLFAKFINTGMEDEKFIEFMSEFTRSLHSKEINGITYDDLCVNPKTGKTYGTKDKYIITPKMERLEMLMNEFLHISKEDIEEVNTLDFVKENVNPGTTEEDVELYSSMLDDYTVEVDNNTKLLDEQNRPSLVALIGYACENEIDDQLKEWIMKFFANNNMYKLNQKDNYIYMRDSFQRMAMA